MDGEQLYKDIVANAGIGLRELAANPWMYKSALDENEELRPEDLDGYDIKMAALRVLEDAGALHKNGNFHTFEVSENYDEEAGEEAFTLLEEYREHLF